jgi:hypothetical protein
LFLKGTITMIGTVQKMYFRNTWCDIKADGEFPNCNSPEWINFPPPRDGYYSWPDPTLPAGTRVSFDKKPGTGVAEPGGTFEGRGAVAINVVAL